MADGGGREIAPRLQAGVLSGPSFAQEVAQGRPTALVAASDAAAVRDALVAAFHGPTMRVYANDDVAGVEVGGAVKNVIALACGITDGMGLGANTRASLITRGLAETARLGAALGAEPATFAGLAGLGDLVATCSSPLSRNRTFGERLGRGMSVQEVQQTTRQVAEGVKSCRPVLDLARAHGVDMPLTEAVVRVCHDGVPVARIVTDIMSREAKPE